MTKLADIDSLANLPLDWDDYESLPTKQFVIDKAKEVASKLPKYAWQAVPVCGDGSAIQLEYHSNDLDIEIYIEVQNDTR